MAKKSQAENTETEAVSRQSNYVISDRLNLRYHRDVAERINLVDAVEAHFADLGYKVSAVTNEKSGSITLTVETPEAWELRNRQSGATRLPRAFRGIFASPEITAKVQAMLDAGATEEEVRNALTAALSA